MQSYYCIMRMSHIQYFHKLTSVRRGSHPVVLVGAPYSSDDLFQLLQDSLFLLMYCDLGHAQRLCIGPCLPLKEQDVDKGIFLIGQLSQRQIQLIFSHLAEYGVLYAFTGIRELPGVVIHQPIQRIPQLGMIRGVTDFNEFRYLWLHPQSDKLTLWFHR